MCWAACNTHHFSPASLAFSKSSGCVVENDWLWWCTVQYERCKRVSKGSDTFSELKVCRKSTQAFDHVAVGVCAGAAGGKHRSISIPHGAEWTSPQAEVFCLMEAQKQTTCSRARTRCCVHYDPRQFCQLRPSHVAASFQADLSKLKRSPVAWPHKLLYLGKKNTLCKC